MVFEYKWQGKRCNLRRKCEVVTTEILLLFPNVPCVSGLTRTFLSVFCGCNKVTQTGGLNRNVSSQFWRLEGWDQGVGGVHFFCGLWQRLCFTPLLQLLLGGWPPLAFLAFSVCLRLHMAFSLGVCLCVHISLFIRTPVTLDYSLL